MVVLPVEHVVGKHLADLGQVKLSGAAESNQELVGHPWILSRVLEVDIQPVLEISEHNNLVIVELTDVAEILKWSGIRWQRWPNKSIVCQV